MNRLNTFLPSGNPYLGGPSESDVQLNQRSWEHWELRALLRYGWNPTNILWFGGNIEMVSPSDGFVEAFMNGFYSI
jgi:hypothetical protein